MPPAKAQSSPRTQGRFLENIYRKGAKLTKDAEDFKSGEIHLVFIIPSALRDLRELRGEGFPEMPPTAFGR